MSSIDWSTEGSDEVVLARLAKNAEAAPGEAPEPARAFLAWIVRKMEQDQAWRENVAASNRAMVLRVEAARADTTRDRREMKALRTKIAALEAQIDAEETAEPEGEALGASDSGEEQERQEEAPRFAPAAEVESDLRDARSKLLDGNGSVEFGKSIVQAPAPCTCAPSEAELAEYVKTLANRHGFEIEEVSFSISANGFVVSNSVPMRGRVRSFRAPTLDGAFESLKSELGSM